MRDPQLRKSRRNGLIGIAGGLSLMVLPILLVGRPTPEAPPTLTQVGVITLGVAAGVAWGAFFGVRGFRAQDEFFQQRTRTAWLWGGMAGLLISVPIYIFVALGGLHLIWPQIAADRALRGAFVLGYGLPAMAQILGALAVAMTLRVLRR